MEVPCTPGSHTSPSSATTDCRADFTGKAAGPMDPCNKSYLSAQILQQERMPALTDEVLCGHAFSVEGKRSQMHSLPLEGHLLPCTTFRKRGKEYHILQKKSPMCRNHNEGNNTHSQRATLMVLPAACPCGLGSFA